MGEITKIPPASEEAERGVIGCVLLDWDKTVDLGLSKFKLTPDSFYYPVCRILWEGIIDLANRATPIDMLTLSEWCKTRGVFDRVGGPTALHKIVDGTPTSAHAEYYMAIVRDKAILRTAIGQCSDAIAEAYQSENAMDFVSRLPGRFLDGYTANPDAESNGQLMARSLQRWHLAAEKRNRQSAFTHRGAS